MILIKTVLLILIGFAGGTIVAGGLYAFITLLKIIQRLSTCTGTAKYSQFFEDCVMVGGILGNLYSIFEWRLPLSYIFLVAYGIFSGIFVGCLAIALAEVIDVIPAISRRIKLKVGLSFLIFCTAIGKGVGSLVQLLIMSKY